MATLDNDTITYLKELCGRFRETTVPEEASLMLHGILDELGEKWLAAVCDPAICRLLEGLIPSMAGDHVVKVFGSLGAEGLYQMSGNPFGSHVAEKLLLRGQELVQGKADSAELVQVLAEVTGHVAASPIEYMSDKCSTHVVRRLLSVLAGRELEAEARRDTSGEHASGPGADRPGGPKRKSDAMSHSHWKVGASGAAGGSGAFRALLAEPLQSLADAVASVLSDMDPSERRIDVLCHNYAGPCLQSLLRALRGDAERLAFLVPVSLGSRGGPQPWDSVDAAAVAELCQERGGSHLLECILGVSPPDTMAHLWEGYLSGQLGSMATHAVANFVAQAVLSAPGLDPEHAEAAVLELLPHVKDLLRPTARREGVIAAAINCALRSESGKAQRQLVKALTRALKDLVPAAKNPAEAFLIVGLGAPQGAGTLSEALAASGGVQEEPDRAAKKGKNRRPAAPASRLPTLPCVSLSGLLAFPKETAEAFWEGMAAMDRADVAMMARDSSGCRVLEAFLDSTAPFRVRRSVLSALEGTYAALVAHSSASARLVEKCYGYQDAKGMAAIASELSAREAEIRGKPWGGYALANCGADAFKKDSAGFEKKVKKDAEVLAEFEEIFGDENASKKKSKKGSKRQPEPEAEEEEEAEEDKQPAAESKKEGTKEKRDKKDKKRRKVKDE